MVQTVSFKIPITNVIGIFFISRINKKNEKYYCWLNQLPLDYLINIVDIKWLLRYYITKCITKHVVTIHLMQK
jgi:hypothetical protein